MEDAERWGDEELQEAARWVLLSALVERPDAAPSFLEGANVPRLPDAVSAPLTRAVFWAEIRSVGPGAAGSERWAGRLPELLDRADALIEAGTIGGERPNAADLQVGASVALLLKLEDLRPALEGRPCADLARRLFPRYAGAVPAGAVPAEWLRAMPAAAHA